MRIFTCWLLPCLALTACDAPGDPFFVTTDWEMISTLSPLPAPPPDPTNKWADDPAAARLGQRFFHEDLFQRYGLLLATDTCNNYVTTDPTTGAKTPAWDASLPCPNSGAAGMSGDTGVVCCNNCHTTNTWFNDPGPLNVSKGVIYSYRNDPSLVDVVYYKFFGWLGTGEWPWVQDLSTAESPYMGANRVAMAHTVNDLYRSDYEAVFGPLPMLDSFPPDARPMVAPAPAPMMMGPGREVAMAGMGGMGGGSMPGAPGLSILSKTPILTFDESNDPTFKSWDSAWNMMAPDDQEAANRIAANIFKAVEAYLRTLTSKHSPFDRMVAGEYGAISKSAKAGLSLFVGKAGCIGCHNGSFFTDNAFHTIGVPAMAGVYENNGHYDTVKFFGRLAPYLQNPMPSNLTPPLWTGAGPYSDDPVAGLKKLVDAHVLNPDGSAITNPPMNELGRYRTKTLRHIAKTAPYMHNGAFSTLEQVVDFYNNGGGDVSAMPGAQLDGAIVPLGLNSDEKMQLIAFLESLTGDPISDDLQMDKSASMQAGMMPPHMK